MISRIYIGLFIIAAIIVGAMLARASAAEPPDMSGKCNPDIEYLWDDDGRRQVDEQGRHLSALNGKTVVHDFKLHGAECDGGAWGNYRGTRVRYPHISARPAPTTTTTTHTSGESGGAHNPQPATQSQPQTQPQPQAHPEPVEHVKPSEPEQDSQPQMRNTQQVGRSTLCGYAWTQPCPRDTRVMDYVGNSGMGIKNVQKYRACQATGKADWQCAMEDAQ